MSPWSHYCNYHRETRWTDMPSCNHCGAVRPEEALTPTGETIGKLAQQAALSVNSIIDAAVNRFLGWKLPADFSPDCGISYDLRYPNEFPIGTNLFTAAQARAMFQYCLTGAQPELPVSWPTAVAAKDAARQSTGWEGVEITSGLLQEHDYTRSQRVTASDLGLTAEEVSRMKPLPDPGETLRDRFAMGVLDGLVIRGVDDTWGNLAVAAYAAADAMMEARRK